MQPLSALQALPEACLQYFSCKLAGKLLSEDSSMIPLLSDMLAAPCKVKAIPSLFITVVKLKVCTHLKCREENEWVAGCMALKKKFGYQHSVIYLSELNKL